LQRIFERRCGSQLFRLGRRDDHAAGSQDSRKFNLRAVEIPPRPKPMKPADIRALLANGAIQLRRTEFDREAACAAIEASSDYPDIAEWNDFFVRNPTSDAEALATFKAQTS